MIGFEGFTELIQIARIGSSDTKYLKEPTQKVSYIKDQVIGHEFVSVEFEKYGVSTSKLERIQTQFNRLFGDVDDAEVWDNLKQRIVEVSHGFLDPDEVEAQLAQIDYGNNKMITLNSLLYALLSKKGTMCLINIRRAMIRSLESRASI